jgi:hypothetical protein
MRLPLLDHIVRMADPGPGMTPMALPATVR